jgi:membrane protein implicated in regulation of membrane protease activity
MSVAVILLVLGVILLAVYVGVREVALLVLGVACAALGLVLLLVGDADAAALAAKSWGRSSWG